jgi:hypothetical protein
MKSNKHILYAAYGSNLLLERFYAYIKGTEFNGKKYIGCKDKTEPEDYGSMMVPHRLYFAKSSAIWGGGVAFLSLKEESDPYYYTLVRLWKITFEQFDDIQRQEGDWYNQILNLGKKDKLDIITFTGPAEFEKEKNPPSDSYIDVIKKGLIQTKGLNVGECEQYIKKFL